jgi:hypothetical protein
MWSFFFMGLFFCMGSFLGRRRFGTDYVYATPQSLPWAGMWACERALAISELDQTAWAETGSAITQGPRARNCNNGGLRHVTLHLRRRGLPKRPAAFSLRSSLPTPIGVVTYPAERDPGVSLRAPAVFSRLPRPCSAHALARSYCRTEALVTTHHAVDIDRSA